MYAETFNRMSGLVDDDSKVKLLNAVDKMSEEFLQEGFEVEDVQSYLTQLTNNAVEAMFENMQNTNSITLPYLRCPHCGSNTVKVAVYATITSLGAAVTEMSCTCIPCSGKWSRDGQSLEK